MAALTSKQVTGQLETVPAWSRRAQTLARTFKFEGFWQSISFVTRIATKAQKLNHHPSIDIRFDRVTLTLTTHEEGGITGMDFALARECDRVFSRLCAP